ncbi:MAG: hypothetical protein HY035_04315 [Nitrospirae bacterium]|nr:hypothetical protein [Nitrospirota bacterium]MBI3377613.1 hypothetical protein [Nitrospirota bacterium]
MTPGGSFAVTRSKQCPSSEWNAGLQFQNIAAGQVGYSFKDKIWFLEYGLGSRGAALTGYYLFGPYYLDIK